MKWLFNSVVVVAKVCKVLNDSLLAAVSFKGSGRHVTAPNTFLLEKAVGRLSLV